MRNVKYINSYANKEHHEQFNAILLFALNSYFRVKMYSGKDSKNNMYRTLREKGYKIRNIDNQNLLVLKGKSGIPNFIRFLFSALYNLLILLCSKKNDILVYNFNNPLSLYSLNKVNSLLKREILIFCHGEMELLINNEGGFLAKILRWHLRYFFLKKRKLFIKYCVLGDSIIENLKPIIKEKIDDFISIDHPYLFEKRGIKEKSISSRISFATIGELNDFKGLDSYLKLLDKVDKENKNFLVIGNVSHKLEEFEKRGVIVKGKDNFIERKEFENLISDIDYALYFYTKDKYKITASGAVLDAINARKPIIALKNDYFSYLFGKYGQIGYLFESIEEMSNRIDLLNDNKKIFNFEKYIEELSVDSFSKKLYMLILKI